MNDVRATQDSDDVPVVLINVLKCQPEKQEALLELLTGLMGIQRDLPGFVSATLHRGLNGRTVANHAVWRSVEDWRAMTRNPDVSAAMNPIMAIATFEPNLYEPGELID
ncbi:antibiotic biosynthesis monooxygenase family protein [Brevundimonas variabilis]|uniref:Heme-degrading monooxygenase HmoA n=1 Tax=Brevundimonas variabilis TaxID=74312 RepID=A0A7W9CJ04_9CAUL|nr:antibiotic biosynthesis monooxygenase family protein [Brevundimonas variabilis]MBB5746512.1 heme-degrading monooxygenase HmoA [Brevundimonas variabilis]